MKTTTKNFLINTSSLLAAKPTKYQYKLKAYHEAGHAIMAFYRNFWIGEVGIELQEGIDRRGYTEISVLDKPYTAYTKNEKKDLGFFIFAGMVAVGILRKKPYQYHTEMDKYDRIELFKLYTKNEQKDLYWLHRFEVYIFLSQPLVWQQVKTVANELLNKKKLTGDDIRKFIE